MNRNAVTMNHLSKIYADDKKAVDNIHLALAPGEIFGFLGPNGAGKTTTVKLLNGILAPTEGCCSVYGIDPAVYPEKTHALSGVVTEHAQMYDHLTGMENLLFYGSLYGLGTAECTRRSLFLLEQMELTDAKNKKLAAYSTGMRKRLSLARALIHQPRVLFLDEPTSGLDPQSTQNVHAIIQNLATEQNITVFLCTHQLRYAQEICTRYGLICEGRLLAEGTLDELRQKACSGITVKIRASGIPAALSGPENNLSIQPAANRQPDAHTAPGKHADAFPAPGKHEDAFPAPGKHADVFPAPGKHADAFPAPGKHTDAFPAPGRQPDAHTVSGCGQPADYLARVQSEAEIPQIVRKIIESGGEIYHISAEQPSLEDLYFALTGKQ